MRQVRLEPAASRSRVKHSTTEPLRFLSRCRKFMKNFAACRDNCKSVIHLQFWAYGSWEPMFPISMSRTAILWVQNTIFNDKSAILLHPGTRWNKIFASHRQNYAQKMQDVQVTKSLEVLHIFFWCISGVFILIQMVPVYIVVLRISSRCMVGSQLNVLIRFPSPGVR